MEIQNNKFTSEKVEENVVEISVTFSLKFLSWNVKPLFRSANSATERICNFDRCSWKISRFDRLKFFFIKFPSLLKLNINKKNSCTIFVLCIGPTSSRQKVAINFQIFILIFLFHIILSLMIQNKLMRVYKTKMMSNFYALWKMQKNV